MILLYCCRAEPAEGSRSEEEVTMTTMCAAYNLVNEEQEPPYESIDMPPKHETPITQCPANTPP